MTEQRASTCETCGAGPFTARGMVGHKMFKHSDLTMELRSPTPTTAMEQAFKEIIRSEWDGMDAKCRETSKLNEQLQADNQQLRDELTKWTSGQTCKVSTDMIESIALGDYGDAAKAALESWYKARLKTDWNKFHPEEPHAKEPWED